MSARAPAPRVLVLSGGLIHLVHQLAVVRELPETSGVASATTEPADIAVLITGVLRRDGAALARLEGMLEAWFTTLRRDDPTGFAGLRLVRDAADLEPDGWALACLNNQWQQAQREPIARLGIRRLLVCGDGLGLYYRCARELRAIAPSLLGLPIREPGRQVRYVLSGRQPRWHRPPQPAEAVPLARRQALFAALVASLRAEADPLVAQLLAAAPADRPLWLCSVPNLAHQFPQQRIAPAVLERWRAQLERRHGFRINVDRLLLLDHPKAPPEGSFGPLEQPWLAGPLRSGLPLEVLLALLREARPEVEIRVCGMTSALYGASRLNGASVVWLSLLPLWQHNHHYRRKPLEFAHRSLRLARMALLCGQREGHQQA